MATASLTRRTLLATAASLTAAPALAEECRLGPPPHQQGPIVFMNYDQVQLDAAYDQTFYEPLLGQVAKRLGSNSDAVRARIGPPERKSYGPSEIERLDIYRTKRAHAPIFVFIHGGAWLVGSAKDSGYAAEMFVNAGANYVALDFTTAKAAGGDIGVMAKQVRTAIAWVYRNAASFGGDPHRLYIGGHSSGGHLCGVALVTDWQGVRPARRHRQGRPVHERDVRHEAGAAFQTQQLCGLHRRDGGRDELSAPSSTSCAPPSPSPTAPSRRRSSSARTATSPPRSRPRASRWKSSRRPTTPTWRWRNRWATRMAPTAVRRWR